MLVWNKISSLIVKTKLQKKWHFDIKCDINAFPNTKYALMQ